MPGTGREPVRNPVRERRRAMRRIALSLALFVAVQASPLQAGCVSPATERPPAAGPAEKALLALVQGYVQQDRLPGLVVAVGRGDGPPTFLSAGTISDNAGAGAAGPDSLWRVFSMTKPITALAAMALIEDGRMTLDQPVSDFIPAFRSMRVLTDPAGSLESRPASRPMTIRHLLTHSSGLIYQFIGKGPLQLEYQRLGLLGGRVDAQASLAQPATLADFAERLAGLPLVAEPGTTWNYSVSADLLGRVIEVASGMTLQDYAQARLLDPIGMCSTYWAVPQPEAARLSTVYAWSDGRRVAVDQGPVSGWLQPPRVHYGGSGLVSSARDYDRLLRMLAGGGRIDRVRVLKARTVRLALSNLLPEGVRVVPSGTPDTALAEGFGAGGWVYLHDVPGGVRNGTYGWFGAAGTVAFIDPASKLRVTVMANYFPATHWPLHQDVVRAVYAR